MASDRSSTTYRGVAIGDESVAVWAAESTYTQAGPQPGVPEPSQDTGMTLATRGSQSAAGHLHVRTIRAGNPEPDGAACVWREDSDASTGYRGWDQPLPITSYEQVRDVDASTTLQHCRYVHALALPDGTVVAAYETQDTSRGDEYGVEVSIRSPTADTWSNVTVYTTGTAPPSSQGFWPCLLRLPSGRLQLYHWVFDPSATANEGDANVRMHYSDDDGATWAVGQTYCLEGSVPYSATAGGGSTNFVVKRLRAAYALGQVCMVGWILSMDSGVTYRDQVRQWASSDLGATFADVDKDWGTSTKGASAVDIVGTPDGFCTAWVDQATHRPKCAVTGSAYEIIANATVIDLGGTFDYSTATAATITDTDLSLCIDETGNLYAFGRNSGANSEGAAHRSTDNGETWSRLGQSTAGVIQGYWWDGQAAGEHLENISVCMSEGRAVMLCNSDGDTTHDECLHAVYLGGWSTVTMPAYGRFPVETERISWYSTWLPIDTPDNLYWTAGGTAGPYTIDTGRLNVVTTANTRFFSLSTAPGGTLDEGLIAYFSMALVSGGSLTTDAVSVRLAIDDTAEDFDVTIRIASTGLRLWDNNAGSQVGSDASITTSAGVDVLIALGKNAAGTGAVYMWYRARSTKHDREWTLGASSTSLTDGGGGGGADTIIWGHRASTTSTTRWYAFCHTEDHYAGYGLHEGFTNPDDLAGRTYSPNGIYVHDGVVVEATDGPSIRGDDWEIETRYDYEIDRAMLSSRRPSPRVGWRSTSTASQIIALEWDSLADSDIGSDVLFLGLYGSNVPQVALAGYDEDTTAWVSIATVNLMLPALKWTRQGETIVPTATTHTAKPYLYHHECAGWYFWAYDTSTHYAREIVTNSEGKWTDATTRTPVLRLTGAGASDPTSGTDGRIVPSSCGILIHNLGTRYRGLRLTIPAPSSTIPSPPDGYWKIGTIVCGPVVVHGGQYGWGRSVETQPGAELREARDRTRRSVAPAPDRRVIEYAWADGFDMSPALASDGAPDPDYVLASTDGSAVPVASRNDTPLQVSGLVRRLNGAHEPLVYLPRIPQEGSNPSPRVLRRRHEHALCRMTSPVRLETIVGNELETEAVRVATIVLEEEV